MSLPRLLEIHAQDLTTIAGKFNPGLERYKFWLQLREVFSLILNGGIQRQERAYYCFENVYRDSIPILQAAAYDLRYTKDQRDAINTFLDQWQGIRESLRETIPSRRSYFSPAEIKLARSNFLDGYDLQVLSGLCLLPAEMEDVFQFVSGMKLRCDLARTRVWQRNSDVVYSQTVRDCRVYVSYKRGVVTLLRAERIFSHDAAESLSESS